MIPRTPRGFRDVLPVEAAWRAKISAAVTERFAAWGYLPIETPAVELVEVLEASARLDNTTSQFFSANEQAFKFFDSDNNLLALRPDVTLPVARLTATRLAGKEGPFRFFYAQPAFTEKDSTYGQDRQFTQLGIEFIGRRGPVADAEVLCVLFEALEAAGVSDFTVALGTVGVLTALVGGASSDAAWKGEILQAFHESDLVAIDRLAHDERVTPIFGEVISEVARLRGGAEAIDACEKLVAPLGCEDGLADLRTTFELVDENTTVGTLMVDFSIVSSFDYYTGMVFKAYAPGVSASLASGGRYDTTLAAYGRTEPAAGFAAGLERLLAAVEAQGGTPPEVGPDCIVEDADPHAMFARAAQLRSEGKRVVLGGE